jgi:hypothetical protein
LPNELLGGRAGFPSSEGAASFFAALINRRAGAEQPCILDQAIFGLECLSAFLWICKDALLVDAELRRKIRLREDLVVERLTSAPTRFRPSRSRSTAAPSLKR